MLLSTFLVFLSVALLTANFGDAAPACPVMGPSYPVPSNLQENGIIRAAVQNLTDTFGEFESSNSAANFSYSIQVFSANDAVPIFERYHTSVKLATFNNTGVKKADENTVYRLGSLTKVLTVYTFLVNDGDVHFNEPVTKFVPELAALVVNSSSDPVTTPRWNEITLGQLASQTSGIVRDYGLLGELTQDYNQSQLESIGFPPLQEQEIPPCGSYPLCNRKDFFAGLSKVYPSFPTYATPAYSNVAFQLLAYALENIKGQNFSTLVQDTVLKPLNLSRTYYNGPPDEVGIIPGNYSKTKWPYDLGDGLSDGNMYSSATDLAKFGRAILKSTLIPPALTRRWLKPVAFTSDPVASVGYPWGIRRVPLSQPYRTVTVFNKAGNIGMYSGLLVVIPDYNIGMSILSAGELPGNLNFNVADTIGESIIPAFENAAREDAQATYGGQYTSSDDHVNSSMIITTDVDIPGIGIADWTSNGTDMAFWACAFQMQYTNNLSPRIRLYPTGLETVATDGSKRVAFKAIFEDANGPARPNKMFSTDCGAWVGITAVTYGAQPLDQFVFNLNPAGKVVSVTPVALKTTLSKTGG